KLLASVLTPLPLTVAIFGFFLNRQLKRIEQLQWANQKLVEKRLEVYSELAPLLNDLYCYFDYIGQWKWEEPPKAMALKRAIDRLFHVHAHLFSNQFTNACYRCIDLYFIPGPLNVYDSSARMRTDINRRKKLISAQGKQWESEWDELFSSPDKITNFPKLLSSYRELMDNFANELGVKNS
ncbi:MAG: hypothetical protein AAGG02_09985, partial [Cyanobacteria bacterium P01_H01_bin.15]